MDLRDFIQSLESQIECKNNTISELEEKIKQLTEEISKYHAQDSLHSSMVKTNYNILVFKFSLHFLVILININSVTNSCNNVIYFDFLTVRKTQHNIT